MITTHCCDKTNSRCINCGEPYKSQKSCNEEIYFYTVPAPYPVQYPCESCKTTVQKNKMIKSQLKNNYYTKSKKEKQVWFAAGGEFLKCGPYDNQVDAWNAMVLNEKASKDVKSIHPIDIRVWPEWHQEED